MWYIYETGQWYENENPENDGGKSYLLGYIHRNFSSFLEWAEEYYESSFVPKIIEKLFLSGNLSYDEILATNPDCKADKIIAEITKGDIL
ncbi:MAG: hypothetical protein K2K14_11075, partial [Ruminococcus sp.]|nr:hypothetical protein [Ruminococcus sp.]